MVLDIERSEICAPPEKRSSGESTAAEVAVYNILAALGYGEIILYFKKT